MRSSRVAIAALLALALTAHLLYYASARAGAPTASHLAWTTLNTLRPDARSHTCSAPSAGGLKVPCSAPRKRFVTKACGATPRYFHYDWGYGRGWNNFLFSLYRAAALATLLGRTLVLPPLASFLGCNNCDALRSEYQPLGCVLNISRATELLDAVPYEHWLTARVASPHGLERETKGRALRYFGGSPRREHAMSELGLDALLRRSEAVNAPATLAPYHWLQERLAGVDVARLRADCEACSDGFSAVHPFASRAGLHAIDVASSALAADANVGGDGGAPTLWFGNTMHALNIEDEALFLHVRCALRPLDDYAAVAGRILAQLKTGRLLPGRRERPQEKPVRVLRDSYRYIACDSFSLRVSLFLTLLCISLPYSLQHSTRPQPRVANVVAVHQRRGDKRDDCFREISQSATCRSRCVPHCAQSAADVAALIVALDDDEMVHEEAGSVRRFTIVFLFSDRDYGGAPSTDNDVRFVDNLRALLPPSTHRLVLSEELRRAARTIWSGARLGDLLGMDGGTGGGPGGAAYLFDAALAAQADKFVGMAFSTVSLNIALQRLCDGRAGTSSFF